MRPVRTMLVGALALTLTAGAMGTAAPPPAAAAAIAQPHETPISRQHNGVFYDYVREGGTTFSSIGARIRDGWYAHRGVAELRIYCPYRASGDFRGVPAIDFFATNTNTGSVADFRRMTAAARSAHMSVTMYVGLLFVDPQNVLWTTAQKQEAQGRSSAVTRLFRWSDTGEEPAPDFGSWEWSPIAKRFYAVSFGYPALDYAYSGTRTYAKTVLRFWLRNGVDGFEYDSPGAYWGMTTADATDIMVTTPNRFSPRAKWLTAEGNLANYDNPYSDSIGLTNTLFNGDDDSNSFVTRVVDGDLTADDLEYQFATYLDPRRREGKGMNAAAIYDLTLPGAERALDAAVTAGNGVLYSTDVEQIYQLQSKHDRALYDRVFKAMASSPALEPAASRTRIPTGSDPQSYATVRTSTDRRRSALIVANLSPEAKTVTLQLRNTGISIPQTPVDLTTNQPAKRITSTQYCVSLPPYGYAFLDVRIPHPAK